MPWWGYLLGAVVLSIPFVLLVRWGLRKVVGDNDVNDSNRNGKTDEWS